MWLEPLYYAATRLSVGADIDLSLTFDKRVSSIVSACNYHLRALRHIRPALKEETAVTVGRAIILSRIDYCNSLKQAAIPFSFVLSERGRALATVRERITYKVAMLTLNALSWCHQPVYLSELLTNHVPARSTRSSSDLSRLVVPRTRNKRATRSFHCAAPTVWNNLPTPIQDSLGSAAFGKLLKIFLYDCISISN